VLLLLFFEFSERNFEVEGVRDVLNMSGGGGGVCQGGIFRKWGWGCMGKQFVIPNSK
jgi:hypothetical protein